MRDVKKSLLAAVDSYLETFRQSHHTAHRIYGPKEDAATLAVMFETSPTLIVDRKLDGTMIGCNLAAAAAFGSTPSELAGTHVSVWVPRDWERFQAIAHEVHHSRKCMEYWESFDAADGRRHQILMRSIPLEGRIINAAIDVTALLDKME